MTDIASARRHEFASARRHDGAWEGSHDWGNSLQHSEILPIGPPGAKLSPDTKITSEQLGKTPCVLTLKGWSGFGEWTKHRATSEDTVKYDRWGANVGLQTRIYHAIDIDVDDEKVSADLEKMAHGSFGAFAVRYRAGSSRWLFLTCIKEGEVPLRKRRVAFMVGGKKQAVELLANGQQCVVAGEHQKGGRILWRGGPHPCECGISGLPVMTRAKADEFFTLLVSYCETLGYEIVADKGNGATAGTRKSMDDPSRWAPSPQHVLDLLKVWRNTPENVPTHEDFVAAMAAIKTSLGPTREDYYADVENWALEYPGNTDEYVRRVWESIR